MRIGDFAFPDPCLALAPMAGVTDKHFRQLCRETGADYLVSEMLSSNPDLRDSRKSLLRGDFAGEPTPLAVQIAGSEPGELADAARYNVSRGASIIDINMGCPAKKVCNKAAGSALLSDPAHVHAILEAVVGAVAVPVTLKIRTGPCRASRNGVEIARIAEQAGIQALAVHGRTRADKFNGSAEYQTIAEIVAAVDIPVFANGDIDTPRKAREVLQQTGAAGLMFGRPAQGNPWLFREVRHFLQTGDELAPPCPGEILQVMQRHLRGLHRHYGETAGVRIARKHIVWYLQDRPHTEQLRRELMNVSSAREQLNLVQRLFLNGAGNQRQAA